MDVADLIALLDRVTQVVLLLWIATAVLVVRFGLPSLTARCGAVAVLIASVAVPLIMLGPKDVFYWMHEMIFPPDHPWFFYWDESLMSTLMKAPDLFGGIALMIAFMAVPLWWGIYAAGQQGVRRILIRGKRDSD